MAWKEDLLRNLGRCDAQLKKRNADGNGREGVVVRTVVTRSEEKRGSRRSSWGSTGELLVRIWWTVSGRKTSVSREGIEGRGEENGFFRKRILGFGRKNDDKDGIFVVVIVEVLLMDEWRGRIFTCVKRRSTAAVTPLTCV